MTAGILAVVMLLALAAWIAWLARGDRARARAQARTQHPTAPISHVRVITEDDA